MDEFAPTEAGEPNPQELLDSLVLKLGDLGRLAEEVLDVELADREVSLIELRVLAICAAHPGITAAGVSGIIGSGAYTLSRVVQVLFQKGLLSRRRSRNDRREVRLRATRDGLALLRECQSQLEHPLAEFLRPLSETQQRSLARIVETLLSTNF